MGVDQQDKQGDYIREQFLATFCEISRLVSNLELIIALP